jgi:LysR family transcriptional activator of nhaA
VPAVLEKDFRRQYGLERIGPVDAVTGRFYAVSVERKIRHPAVAAICESARRTLFAAT